MPLPIALDYRPALLSRAGIGRATRELARALANCPEISVHLFGHSLARARVATNLPPTVQLHRLPVPGRSLAWLQRLGIRAERLAGNARVFHLTDYVHPPTSARTVLTVHDLAFEHDASWHGSNSSVLRERTHQAVAAATALVVPSATTARDLRTFAPTAPTPQVIAFGADHVPTERLPEPLAGRAFALCVGTIEPRKNHLRLLEAWRRLATPRPLLVITGGVGWQCDEIVRELERAEQDGLVRWLRNVGDRELWALMQHARLLAYPSLWEGFGFPPLEAMAMGVPVVANDCAPLQELGDEALAFADATNVDALTATIERVLADDPYRQRLIAAGQQRAASFTWQTCANAHAKLYLEVGA